MPCCGLHCTLVCKEASKDMNTETLYTQGHDDGDGQDDGDARGHPELINTVQKVSKWRGRPRIAKRDQLSHLG